MRGTSFAITAIRHLLFVSLLVGNLAFGADAVERGTSTPDRKTIVLISTAGRRDKAITDLFESALEDVAKLKLSESPDDADLIGELQVAHSTAGTTLRLSIVAHNGALLCRTTQTVPPGGSLVDAAQSMVRPVRSAVQGADAPPQAVTQAPTPLPAAEPQAAAPAPESELAPAQPEPAPVEDSWEDRGSSPGGYRYQPRRLDFMAGLELGGGIWTADPSGITENAPTGFDFSQYAPAFTRTLSGQFAPSLGLHGGWKFLGIGAIEAAIHSSLWSTTSAILAGVRATAYPLQAFLPDRKFDLGVEIGGGYAFVGSGLYDMSGSYFTFGFTGEYPLTKWLGLTASYRFIMPILSKFYVDYKNGITEPVGGFTAFWNTLTVGVSFHMTKYL